VKQHNVWIGQGVSQNYLKGEVGLISEKRSYSVGLLIVFMLLMGLILPATVTASGLTDISGHWAEKEIAQWVEEGVVNGYPDGTFRPNESITRAEFMTLINRVFGFTKEAGLDFIDVKAADWFYKDIAKAVGAGYISGYPDNTVKPGNRISRQEAAVALCKALELPFMESDEKVKGFSDFASIPGWSRSYVNALVEEGLIAGYPDGSFRPTKDITRAETVAMLAKGVTVEIDGKLIGKEKAAVSDRGSSGSKDPTEPGEPVIPEKSIIGISSIGDINVLYGTKLADLKLPGRVTATLDDGNTKSFALTWNTGQPKYDGDLAREYVFTGVLTLTDGFVNPNNLTATVKVIVTEKGVKEPEEVTLVTKAIPGLPTSVVWVEGCTEYVLYFDGQPLATSKEDGSVTVVTEVLRSDLGRIKVKADGVMKAVDKVIVT
jgi:hypothetical protein